MLSAIALRPPSYDTDGAPGSMSGVSKSSWVSEAWLSLPKSTAARSWLRSASASIRGASPTSNARSSRRLASACSKVGLQMQTGGLLVTDSLWVRYRYGTVYLYHRHITSHHEGTWH